jgi:hypothetical protein
MELLIYHGEVGAPKYASKVGFSVTGAPSRVTLQPFTPLATITVVPGPVKVMRVCEVVTPATVTMPVIVREVIEKTYSATPFCKELPTRTPAKLSVPPVTVKPGAPVWWSGTATP